MTHITGIGRSKFYRQIWTGYPKTVIMPEIISHESLTGHMTVDTVYLLQACFMFGMLKAVVFFFMTLRTHLVSGKIRRLAGMWIMTITTFHPAMKHFTLQKRSINIIFRILLPVDFPLATATAADAT